MQEMDAEFNKTLQEWAVLFARRSIHDFLRFAREHHLSMAQISVLLRLYYSGSSTILNLRADLVGSRAAASQMIDELVQNGWVERGEHPSDRRVKAVRLTPAGRQLVEQGIAARRQWLAQLADDFSPQQRQEIYQVMRLMIQAAQAHDPAADRSVHDSAAPPSQGEDMR